jgi:L-amino acid N-acyltransferase YncA
LPGSVVCTIRPAGVGDLAAIGRIYNEGIDDRVATLETQPKSARDIDQWWAQHDERYAVLVATESDHVVGWAALNRFSHRRAHDGIADLSVYVARSHRGRGVGATLLFELERVAKAGAFHKIVLHALNANDQGKRLYGRAGFVEVGVFKEHGILDGRCVDVVAMEKLL